MRLRSALLKRRVNGNLKFRYQATGLTSYAGLELVRRFFVGVGLKERLCREVRDQLPATDFSGVALIVLLVTLLVTGGRRVKHIGYLDGDPMVLRLCGLARLPTARSLSRWLARFSDASVAALAAVNATLAADTVAELGLRTLTVDVDGSVICTGLTVDSAARGFNPHHRKVPSYYPITAYEARSGLLMRCQNRPGNVHDGKASLEFLDGLFTQLQQLVPRPTTIEMRMDGAFFRRDVLERLEQAHAHYAIKVPFYRWLPLREAIVARRRWRRIDKELSYFQITPEIGPWQRRLRIVIFRRKVAHQTRKNFQLDLFDPDDGHFEYSAITTNLRFTGPVLWQFMAGRGTHEKVFAELKNGYAFDAVPSRRYAANSAWQQLNLMAFNLVRCFQMQATCERRRTDDKRRTVFRFHTIQTLRFKCFSRAGVLTRPNGRAILDVGTSLPVREFFQRLSLRLQFA